MPQRNIVDTIRLHNVPQRNIVDTIRLHNVPQRNIVRKSLTGLSFLGENMQENAMYFGKSDLYQKIRTIGGTWADTKERPLVCLIKSTENENLFWAIPVGDWRHRDESAQKRIEYYMSLPPKDLRSCFYHVGKTNIKSIFFISDVIPITESYIDREYRGFDKNLYIIKNPKLIQALTEKLRRILAFEASNKNYFRQHITNIKNLLIGELVIQQTLEQASAGKDNT